MLCPYPTVLAKDPGRAVEGVVLVATDGRGAGIGGQRDRISLSGSSDRAGAGELRSGLRPHPAALGKNPGRSVVGIIAEPAHHGGVAVGGQRDRIALQRGAGIAATDQLRSLLAPHDAALRKDPGGAVVRIIAVAADDGGVAGARQRDRDTLCGAPHGAGADELRALLGPDAAAAGKDPSRPGTRVVRIAAD